MPCSCSCKKAGCIGVCCDSDLKLKLTTHLLERIVMPIFLQAPAHDPKGCDGNGWNRIAIHGGGMCMDECALKPKTLAAFLDAQDTRKVRYGQYGPCHSRGNCSNCKVMTESKKLSFFGEEIFIRADEKGSPWIMNRKDRGWEEFGKLTTWQSLLTIDGVIYSRFTDEFSSGVVATRVAE